MFVGRTVGARLAASVTAVNSARFAIPQEILSVEKTAGTPEKAR
jgi:hypothetical protein